MQNAFVPQKQRWSCPLGSSLSPTFDSVPGVAGLPRDGNGHVESQNGAVAGRGGQTGSSLSPPDQASVVWGGGAVHRGLVSVTAHPPPWGQDPEPRPEVRSAAPCGGEGGQARMHARPSVPASSPLRASMWSPLPPSADWPLWCAGIPGSLCHPGSLTELLPK